jgi:hypothetical protein
MRSDAARSVHPIGAGDWRSGAVHRCGFADDRRPIWSNAAHSVDAIGASGGVALWSKSERAHHDHHGEREVFDLDFVHISNNPGVLC